MKGLFINLWENVKKQPDIWFFFGFLLTFTLSIRKVLFFYPILGNFNEYSGAYFYLSDLFLILTLLGWSILYNKKHRLSTKHLFFTSIKIFKVNKVWINKVIHNLYIVLPFFLVLFSFVSIFWSQNQSIALFRSIKFLEFYFLYLYIILRFIPQLFHPVTTSNVPPRKDFECSTWNIQSQRGKYGTLLNEKQNSNLNCSTYLAGRQAWNNFGRAEQFSFLRGGIFQLFFSIILFLGLFQAIIGIIQFCLQKSVGLIWLKESLISPEILGVAKIILDGETYIRAYGLMPHPNILGGFLLFSIIITLLYKKMFHVEHFNEIKHYNDKNVPPTSPVGRRETLLDKKQNLNLNCSTHLVGRQAWNIRMLRESLIFWSIISIQIIALLLTFSKSAIMGLFIFFIYIIFSRLSNRQLDEILSNNKHDSRQDCSTWNNCIDIFSIKCKKVFHLTRRQAGVEHFKIMSLSFFVFLFSLIIIIRPNFNSLFFNSLNERVFYLNVPRGTFQNDPIFGIGTGQSVLSMQKYFSEKLEFWQYQPVHNVFLIILIELGLVGLIIFVWWLWKLFFFKNGKNSLSCNNMKCSTWNISYQRNEYERSGVKEVNREKIEERNNQYILYNDNINLSRIIISGYFKGMLLGFVFIMLFDHYLWDIQQGSFIFWLTAGFIAGLNRR